MKKKLIFFLLSLNKRVIWDIVVWYLKRNNGEIHSTLLREVFKKYRGIDIGLYSNGSCFQKYAFSPNTIIGRYCSFAGTAKAFNRDHSLEYISTHAFFFNKRLKYCEVDTIEYSNLEIGHDVWIGENAIILSKVNKIGTGAIIGAGSIVMTDIPAYAIVAGNPARIVKYRFDKDTIEELLTSKWWEKPIEELNKSIFLCKLDRNILDILRGV